jgi:alkylation response protein AidB-like acyl-CoA dehydrogenase
MFAEAIEDILRDHCTPAQVRAIEDGGSPSRLWAAFSEAGFLDLLRAENEGGAALPLPELFPLLTLFGRYAVPVPVSQAIAARALVSPGVALPGGPLTLAPALVWDEEGRPRCPLVPFGSVAAQVVAADGDRLVLLDVEAARCSATGVAGSQVASVAWDKTPNAEPLDGDARALAPLAAAVHAALMAGAMARVFEMTLQYCNDRQQFGRPLGKFQAIQHQLSVMAEQVAAVSIAAEAAFETDARTPAPLRAAIAKARASEAVPLVADTAHALHGAIGVTEEYDLQLYTRRLREWRWTHGSEHHWNRIVGEAVLASQAPVAEFVRTV